MIAHVPNWMCCLSHLVLLAVLLRLLQLLLQAVEQRVRALLTQRLVNAAVVAQHVEE